MTETGREGKLGEEGSVKVTLIEKGDPIGMCNATLDPLISNNEQKEPIVHKPNM